MKTSRKHLPALLLKRPNELAASENTFDVFLGCDIYILSWKYFRLQFYWRKGFEDENYHILGLIPSWGNFPNRTSLITCYLSSKTCQNIAVEGVMRNLRENEPGDLYKVLNSLKYARKNIKKMCVPALSFLPLTEQTASTQG